MRILLVEDDRRISRALALDLKHQHHTVDIANDGLSGWELAESSTYDLILLDVMLPKLDGISLCKRLRTAGVKTLVLMLTARDTTADKVLGLDAGADDYLVKPFALEELTARVRALGRRTTTEIKQTILENGDLKLDCATGSCTYAGHTLTLTAKEYMILEYFLHNSRKIVTRSDIFNKLWELDKLSSEETVKTHITNLRRKLKLVGADENLIETVYGIGYRLQCKSN